MGAFIVGHSCCCGGRHCIGIQVSEEEAAAGLGPEWPRPRMLLELQRQAVALSYEAIDMRKREALGAARAGHLCAMLLSILSTTRRLQVL